MYKEPHGNIINLSMLSNCFFPLRQYVCDCACMYSINYVLKHCHEYYMYVHKIWYGKDWARDNIHLKTTL